MDHHYNIGASGKVEGYMDQYYHGKRATVSTLCALPIFWRQRDYLRGFGYQGSASRQSWAREIAEMTLAPLTKMPCVNPVNGVLV
jgi:hypothetical protein